MTISHCFVESNILEEPIHKALLYFNLPYDLIVKNVKKPRLLFEYEKNKTQKKIEDVLEAFEKEGNNSQIGGAPMIPNVILLKISNEHG